MAVRSEGGLRNYPLVSIIIPTFNSEATTGACLESIKGQTYPNIEVIVVDRYSSDETREIAKKFNTKVLLTKVERSAARNCGASAAKGLFIFYLDSDMELTPKVVEECVTACLKEGADAVIIPEKPVARGFLGECRKIEKELFISDRFTEIPRFFWKEAFLKIGGFNERLVYGEDADLYVRLEEAGYKTRRVEAEVKHYEGVLSLRQIVFKAHNYGKSLPLFVRRNPSLAVKRSNLVRLFSLRNLKLLLRRPANFLGLIFMKFVEYMGYLTGVSARLLGVYRTKWGRISIDFAILTFLAVIIFRNFLFTSEWPAGGDVLGWISRAYIFGKDFRWLYLWRPYSFGFVEGINSMDFFLMLMYFVIRDAAVTIKAFMFLTFLMAGFSMYAFAYRYTRQNIAALSAALIYTLNQWFFSQFTEAHIDITFSYALAPLIFLILDKSLKTGKLRDIFVLALGLSLLLTGFHPVCAIIYGIFLVLFAIFYVLTPSNSCDFRARFKRFLKTCLPAVAMVFLLSSFSLIPLILNVKAQYLSSSFIFSWEEAYHYAYKTVVDAFTLNATESWGYTKVLDVITGVGLPDFPTSTLLLALFFLAYCTIFLRRDRYTFFFLVSAFVSIFLSKGPHPPFGYIFTWAWFNVPYFAAFRAVSRWTMMTAFSHAFFVSVLVSGIANYLRKSKRLQKTDVLLNVKMQSSEGIKVKEVYVSFDALNKVVRGLHKFLQVFSLLLLILIFLSGFFSSWFFFYQGLQVYTPPKSYLEPYEWLAQQPGDYKIVTVSQSPAEWLSSPWAESDFAWSYMLTDVGWGHDIGYDSSFIHDKPTFQDGGWMPLSHAVADYLRFYLVRRYLTDDLMKIVGTMGYKYVVLPAYSSSSTKEFFLKQEGNQPVYNQSSIILENKFYSPQIFATAQHLFVIGGLESFSSLSKIDPLNLNQTALIFVNQIDDFSPITHSLFNSSKALVFVGSDMLDMIMLSLENKNLIYAAEYGAPSVDCMKYWIRSSSWRCLGTFVLGGDTLTTFGKNEVSIPFKVESDGTYEVWLRVGVASQNGKLSVLVDHVMGGEIQPRLNFWSGLMWINITCLNLKRGDHTITLKNDGTGSNDIDAIAIVTSDQLKLATEHTLNALENFSGRLIYVMEAESTFTRDIPRGWYLLQSPYNGFLLYTYGAGENVSPEGKATASSIGWGLKPESAIDGRLDTRWASACSGGMPQWLQIEWSAPQELGGVHILFERAFARNYTIQTWDGRNWVNVMNVTGNTLLERFHYFEQPVQTTKLRIYFTGDIGYGHISLWELEAYTRGQPTISTKIEVPREGYYKFAFRLASGPDYGSLNLTINDFKAMVSCADPNMGFKWYEIEQPVYLKPGEQEITLSAKGPIDFDEMIIYSLQSGEDNVSLNSLFGANSASPSVSYEKISPVEYRVHVKSDEPFLLIFSEAYHPLWRVYVDGQEVSPITTYFLVNGFFINKTGELDIRIYFTGQTYADIGLGIAITTLVVASTYLIIQSDVFKGLRSKTRALTPKADKGLLLSK